VTDPAPTLQQLIADALETKPFSITGAALGSQPITTLLTAHLGSDAIRLSGAQQVSATGTTVVVSGQLVDPLHGVSGLTADATFTDGATRQLAVSLTGLPPGWDPSRMFPALADGLVDDLGYSSSVLLLDSSGALDMPEGYPADLGFPALPPGTVQGGLGLRATVTPPSGGSGLTWLLVAASWEVSGPIGLLDGLPLLCLSYAPQPGRERHFGNYEFPFGLTLATAPIAVPTPPSPGVRSVLQLDAAVEKETGKQTLELPFRARVTAGDLNVIAIALDLPPKTGIELGELEALLAGGTTAEQIPKTGIPALDDISLERIELVAAPASASLIGAGVTVGYATQPPWSPLGGLVSIDRIAVAFNYVPGATKPMTTQMSARIELGGGYLDATIDLPEVSFAADLEPGQKIDIAELVKSATDGSISMGAQIHCTALKLTGDITQDSYGFAATVTDTWEFHLGSVPLALQEVGFAIDYDPNAGTSGEVVGTFLIAGGSLYVRADYAKTTHWTFSGGTLDPVEIEIGDLITDVENLFGLKGLSAANTPAGIKLDNLNISYSTGTGAFSLKGLTSFPIAGSTFDLGVEIALESGVKRFRGDVWFEGNAFTLDFEEDQSTTLSASWVEDPDTPPLTLEMIASALELTLPQLPSELDIELSGASFTYVIESETLVFEIDTKSGGHALLAAVPASGGGHQLVVGAELGGELSLSDLPLVGHALAGAEALSVSGLSAFATGESLPAATVGTINALLPPASAFKLPVAGLPGDITLAAVLCAGTAKTPLALSAGGAGGTGALVTTQTTAAQPSTLWLPVQRSFGPVTVSQVGVRYAGGAVWFEISGGLAAGPFSLQLVGLGFGVPLSDPTDVLFRLDGLGVSYSEPPLSIAGSFTNLSSDTTADYQGGLVIEAEAFTLEAFGYYGDGGAGPGQTFPSMFIFLEGGAEIGGPPFFFVTGFAAGFGLNSSVTLPTVDQVAAFPMIAALPGTPQPNPNALGGPNPSPLTVLGTLTSASPPWIVPERGEFWGAAGITFTTFDLVQSQALLVVEAGQDLSLTLLGLSTARLPQEGDHVYAQIELELEARLEPAQGEFWFEAVLAPSSFLIDPACHLTGGFAFCIWFGPSPHAGDFVLTLGGYHPAFSPPAYYPAVPRLGISWQPGGGVTVGGKGYLALTPSAFMLGGELDVTFQSGNLRAWLTAGADVIIHWSPFWFDAHIWISVGASYRLDLLATTVTLSFEIGADLELWGPPTGGTVTVDLYVIKFSIPFGSTGPDTGDADWTTIGKMLPGGAVTMSATSGRTTPAGVAAPAPGQPWVVRGASFAFTTATPVPASHVTVGTDAKNQTFTYDRSFPALAVRPLAATGLSSTHVLTITDANGDSATDAFTVKPVLADVPASLWGQPVADGSVPSSTGQLVAQQAVGVTLAVKPPTEGTTAGPVAVDGVLAQQPLDLANAVLPVSPSVGPAGPSAKVDPDALSTVTGSSGISSQDGSAARTALLTGLAAAGVTVPAGVNPVTFADQAGTYLVDEPLLAVLA
jgi:hypothetical protein